MDLSGTKHKDGSVESIEDKCVDSTSAYPTWACDIHELTKSIDEPFVQSQWDIWTGRSINIIINWWRSCANWCTMSQLVKVCQSWMAALDSARKSVSPQSKRLKSIETHRFNSQKPTMAWIGHHGKLQILHGIYEHWHHCPYLWIVVCNCFLQMFHWGSCQAHHFEWSEGTALGSWQFPSPPLYPSPGRTIVLHGSSQEY